MADQEEEFQEEEMWGAVLKEKERKSGFKLNPKKKKSVSSSSSSTSCLSAAWHLPLPAAAPKMMNHKSKNVSSDCDTLGLQQSSAPMKIQDWYNIQKSNIAVDDDNGKNIMNNGDEYFVEIDDDDEEEMIPPHEYIAKKMARTRIVSHSMCEGIGRTLKGRDLCKLRNAILTQTGFLEE